MPSARSADVTSLPAKSWLSGEQAPNNTSMAANDKYNDFLTFIIVFFIYLFTFLSLRLPACILLQHTIRQCYLRLGNLLEATLRSDVFSLVGYLALIAAIRYCFA